ncbi:FecR/PupR family sigma factor regulator [Glaciecola petra]|uniref:DUF4880 domain-containing protein n=1 Tax=Glaciecola petra TaxID=3075602 RepID=A0ABU2ZVE7_9ALTE|nr:DUF4880 domain-containing protein [Aestuariibacter sp. P117]MDT0596623.1 DUF4880 domain-containing protein [Aestuariibacter sp. P117]
MSFDEWAGYDLSQKTLDEAAEWLVRLDASENNASSQRKTGQMLAFYEWLENDPSHQQAYAELSELWAKSACMKEAAHLLHASKVLNFPGAHVINTNDDLLNDASLPLFSATQKAGVAAPATYYKATIALISLGLCLPFFLSLL